MKVKKTRPGEPLRAQLHPTEHDSTAFIDNVPCASLKHQKLCLKIDFLHCRLYGYTELKVLEPTGGVIGLHAHALNIEKVAVDGLSTPFEYSSGYKAEQNSESSMDASYHGSVSDAADTASSFYLSSFEKEMGPELLIFLPQSNANNQDQDSGLHTSSISAEKESPVAPDNKGSEVPTEDAASKSEEKVKLVQIDYWIEAPDVGAHFCGYIFHSSNQLNRARCWFPCIDSKLHRCSFDFEITVDSNFVAVSNGKLLYQVLSKEGPHLKTYVYKLDIPVSAQQISLIIAPLEVFPDRQNPAISHLCNSSSLSKLQHTVGFFQSVFSYYEDYLGAPFPFGCYSQVFIDSDAMVTSALVGASMVMLSSHFLVDERVIDQTIRTRIKLAHLLAQQWFGIYISPASHTDAWLLEGLAGFLADLFVKRHFGNNEACYHRIKANEAVCKADIEGFAPLSLPAGIAYLQETETCSVLGQIRTWKATAIIQMLEKQMGPESFRKILQRIILRAQDHARDLRTLSTKEFRHFANKIGNLERPFLKDFFPRWVESSGCPVLRIGYIYSKRRNMIELAVHRGCTAASDENLVGKAESSIENGKCSDAGWPGMMSIRVHELDGMYDHPSLPMAGDTYQLLEIHCHSKLAGRKIQRPKKGNKAEGTEELEPPLTIEPRQGIESPLLWLRADPQMEYLAEICLHQSEQMWINQLERDKDILAQIQAISSLASLPQMSFAAVNALNSCLNDSKVFCRVRIEAGFALASTSTEATDWTGLSHLISFYKNRRYDHEIGLPRSNDFHDLAEYFVLQTIPGAVAIVRGSDGASPSDAVDFILQLLKHNDNSGNIYSDVYWLSSLIHAIGKLEFGKQTLQTLPRMLKRIDRFLQYDRLMPSYNGVLTISCIHTLTELALKFSHLLSMDRFEQILNPFRDSKTTFWRIRVEALRALVDLQFYSKGLDAGLKLALHLIDTDPSRRVQNKVIGHVLYLTMMKRQSKDSVSSSTLAKMLNLIKNRRTFNNTVLRHHIFSLLQVLAGRPATLIASAKQQVTVPPMEVTVSNVIPQEPSPKMSSLKVRIQKPQELQFEPVRIRLPLKDSLPAVSVNSSGRPGPDTDRKVGVLKLRLRPSSSAQETEEVNDKPPGPVHSCSVSMEELGLNKVEVEADAPPLPVNESPHSRKPQYVDGSSGEERHTSTYPRSYQNVVVEPREHSMKDFDRHAAALPQQAICSLEKPLSKFDSESTPSQEFKSHLLESQSEHRPEVTIGGEDLETQAKSYLEDEGSSRLEAVAEDDMERRDTACDKVGDERKSKKRKKDDRKRDKHKDPEYLERKRLKKEHKRHKKERLLMQKVDENQRSEIDTNVAEKKPAVGASETVVRIRLKKS